MRSWMRVGVPLLFGCAVFVLLFPFSGEDSDPSRHYSVFGYEVPTGSIWLALAGGAIAAGLVWLVLARRHSF